MPTLVSSMPPSSTSFFPSSMGSDAPHIVTLNVGGQLFQTTRQTLSLAGPASLLSRPHLPAFIDRDPHLFALLLSLLRTNRLPSSYDQIDASDLAAEAQFYGIDPSLLSPSSNHADYDVDNALDLSRTLLLPLNGRDPPSAFAAGSSTSSSVALHVAHGGKITSFFDPSLSSKSTVLTSFPALDSLLSLRGSLLAAGAVDFPGLQILDLANSGRVKNTLNWNNGTGAVQAIGSSPDHLMCSFESIRRNSSAVVLFDRAELRQVAEIGHKEIYGAELDSAIPATKLKWVAGSNLLLASGSHAGPSGLTGNIRLWDVRSNNVVWEITEKADCFADVDVSDALSAIFKVGVNSGDVFMRDLRMLSDPSWRNLGGGSGSANGTSSKGGSGCLVECRGNKVFVSRGGDVEIWSEVVTGSGMRKNEDGFGDGERVMRRNVMGRREDLGGKKILKMGFSGRRMVLVRKEEQCVEVWESSAHHQPGLRL